MALSARATVRRLCTVAAVVILAITLGSVSAAGQTSPSGSRPAGHTSHLPPGMRPASVSPRGAFGRILSAAQAVTAAAALAGFCRLSPDIRTFG